MSDEDENRKISPVDHVMGDILAIQAVLISLARELLHNQGTDAFVRAEEQATQFTSVINRDSLVISNNARAFALSTVCDIFALAEDLPRLA